MGLGRQVRIVWTHKARADMADLQDYIAGDKPDAAIAVGLRIVEAAKKLADHPVMGRAGRVPRTRELVVADTPYVVVYRVCDNTLNVLRILHTSMQWPERM